MAQKTLVGKLEADVEIQAEALLFHDVFSCRPHRISSMSPDNIKKVDILQGEWGKEGSIICWNYFHDGKHKIAKELIEKIDDENLSTTFKVIGGDLLKEYKSFKLIVKATPKGQGGLVHWSFEYEKLKEDTPDPHMLLEICLQCSKDIIKS